MSATAYLNLSESSNIGHWHSVSIRQMAQSMAAKHQHPNFREKEAQAKAAINVSVLMLERSSGYGY